MLISDGGGDGVCLPNHPLQSLREIMAEHTNDLCGVKYCGSGSGRIGPSFCIQIRTEKTLSLFGIEPAINASTCVLRLES